MSWNTIYDNTSFALGQQARRLAELQQQVASGMRMLRSSDSPAEMYRALDLREQVEALGAYQKNLDEVTRTQEISHSLLQEISSSLASTKQELSQVVSDTYSADIRAMIGEKVDATLEQVLSLANTKRLGRSLLGGTRTGTTPFAAQRTNGRITAVDYQGGLEDLLVPVAPGVTYAGTIVGGSVLGEDDRQPPAFTGTTGLAPGTATSNVRGDLYLTAVHTQTTFAGGTGVTAGTSSAADDTVLGGHTLTIVGGGTKTISLNGGPAVTFDGTETDLAVTGPGPNGVVVHVDMTGWVAFAGDVAITGEGKLTIDGGASYTNLAAFVDNVAVTDSTTSRVLYVDATNVVGTGLEVVRVPGTHDAFGTLINARDVLLNERDLGQQTAFVSEAMDALDSVMLVLIRKMTGVGARLQAMDTLQGSLETIQIHATNQAASLEDADIVQVASELARTQALYEMTLAVSAKLLRMSLLDFI